MSILGRLNILRLWLPILRTNWGLAVLRSAVLNISNGLGSILRSFVGSISVHSKKENGINIECRINSSNINSLVYYRLLMGKKIKKQSNNTTKTNKN